MIEDFPRPHTLPGGYKSGPPTDSTTYQNLNRIAANLVDRCVFDDERGGWQPTGQYEGIGVFIWSTDSQQDKEIGDEEARGMDVTLDTFGNGSAVLS